MNAPYPHVFRVAFAAVLSLASMPCSAVAAESRINKDAQALAKILAPSPPAKAVKANDVAALRKRMISAIEFVEKQHRSNGPRPESLIENALDFREDMGDYERLLTFNSVISAWRVANGKGCFSEKGAFHERITRGRGVGDKCYFELAVPADRFPAASNQLANVRLVTEEKKRPKDAEPDSRETAFRAQLEKLIEEKTNLAAITKFEKGEKTNSLGQTEKEALLAWEKEVELAGDLDGQLPNIRLLGRISGTPSNLTKERWRVTAEVTNISSFPTEVTIDIYHIGITDRKRDHYLMSKTTETLKLRRSESRSIDAYTRAEKSYKGKADDHDEVPKKERRHTKVRSRGFVMVVRYGEKVVAFTGSDQRLASYGDPSADDSPLKLLPKF